ncbi:MAG: hypothetical protein WBG71_14375 [Leeuwenhoekiella sp.]
MRLLDKITPDYRSFVDDQVLTAGQLNEILNHLEDQNRLARIGLHGVGIVCGFTFKTENNPFAVILEQGCGVTTDGDLLKLLKTVTTSANGEELAPGEYYEQLAEKQLRYTHFRSFEDENAKYPPFHKKEEESEENAPLQLYEMREESTVDEAKDKPIYNQFLADKIGVLYLESYPQKPDICTETNCDNQGARQVRKLRLLLVQEKEVEALNASDTIFRDHDIFKILESLPEIKMPRLILNSGAKVVEQPPKIDLRELLDLFNTRYDLQVDYQGFSAAAKYSNAPKLMETAINAERVALDNRITAFKPTGDIRVLPNDVMKKVDFSSKLTVNTKNYNVLARTYQNLTSATVKQLHKGFSVIFEKFSGLLSIEEESASQPKELLSYLEKLLDQDLNQLVQYTYDHVRDLVHVYNELREQLLLIQGYCCPPVTAFPKHLLLGKVVKIDRPATFRHGFYPSAITQHGLEPMKKAKFLIKKAQTLVTHFNPFLAEDVGITPSNFPRQSEHFQQAIPFYYKPDAYVVLFWNFEKSRRYREKFNLGYHRSVLDKSQPIQQPLRYDLGAFNFLRIEGIQGMNYLKALEKVNSLRKNNGLTFDLKAINIDQSIEDIDLDDYACHFDHLESDLNGWIAEQDCLNAEITEFFSGFNIKDLGSHNYSFEQFDRPDIFIKDLQYLKPVNVTLDKGIAQKVSSSNNAIKNLNFSVEKDKSPTEPEKIVANAMFADVWAKEKPSVSVNTGYKEYVPIKQKMVVNDTVKKTLNTKENDVGFIFDAIITDKFVGNSLDIYSEFFDKYQKLFPYYPKTDPNDRKIGLEIPAKILSLLHTVSSHIPSSLHSVTKNSKTNFMAAMNELCGYVKEARATVNEIFYNPEIDYKHYGYETLYVFMLDRLQENCCAAERLALILEVIEKKKADILSELLFENFARKHPGLEHMAGVPMGGTFVMVYTGRNQKGIGENISRDTVVADFALPYQCCSGCAPIAFIVPDAISNGSLLLKRNEICLDSRNESPEKVAFEVSPENAVVAMVNKNIEGITIEKNQINVDPKTLNAYGTPIGFTVNGQMTSVSLTVFRKPQLRITTTPEKPKVSPGSFEPVKMHFENLNNFNTSRFKYQWKIEESEYATENAIHPVKIGEQVDAQELEIPMELTLTDELCGETKFKGNISVLITSPDKTLIALSPTTFCSDDKKDYTIEVIPPDDKAEVTGRGVQKVGARWVFIPAEAGSDTTIKLTSGNAIDVTVVKQIEEPTISQEFDEEKGTLTISVKSPIEKGKYTWFFGGRQLKNETKPQLVLQQGDKAIRGNLFLEMSTGPCGAVKSNSLEINIPGKEGEALNPCAKDRIAELNENFQALEKLTANADGEVLDIKKSIVDLYNQLLKQPEILSTSPLPDKFMEAISSALETTHNKALDNRSETAVQGYFNLYVFVMQALYTSQICQDKQAWTADNLINLLNTIEDHFDKTNSTSFTNMKIKFNAAFRKNLETFQKQLNNENWKIHFETLIKMTQS